MNKEKFQQFLYQSFPIIRELGITIEFLDADTVETALPFSAMARNHLDTVYAGVQFTVMEVTGGIIFAAGFDIGTYFIVVKEMTIKYLKAARGDLRCRCVFTTADRTSLLASLEKEGKATWVLPIELMDSQGDMVATAEAHYFISPQRRKS